MVQGDIPGALAVAASGWSRFEAQAGQPDFNEMFNCSTWRPFFYVAEIDSQIVGIAGYGVSWLNYGVYDMFWVGVLESFRGRGIGVALVSRCLADLEHVADQVILATDIPDFYFTHWDFRVVCKLPTTQVPDDVLMVKMMTSIDKPDGQTTI